MRRVQVTKNVGRVNPANGRMIYSLENAGEALFHQFGVDYEEFGAGPGNYSTAIIEWPDGKVEGVPVGRIQFILEDQP